MPRTWLAGLAVAIGPVVGGFLLEHFWWGSVFLVNVPIAAVAIGAALWLVPESRDPKESRFDPLGALLSTAGLATVVWAIVEAPSRGWTSGGIVEAFAAGSVLLVAFGAWELRAPSPMLDLSLFRNRRFSAASLSVTLVFFSLMGTIFFLTQYLQSVLGFSALASGVRVIPISMGMIVGAGAATKLVDRLGTKALVAAGLAVCAGGLGIFSLATTATGYGLVAAALGVVGIGMGLSMAPATDSIMGAVPADKASLGSAINDTTRMVGGTLGVAILGSVLSSSYRSHVAPAVSQLHGAAAAAAHDRLQGALDVASQIGGAAGRQLALHADSSFVSAMDATLRVGVVFALAGALLALLFLPARAEHAPEPVAVDGDLALAA